MAPGDYHENSFIFKTITFVRILAGVAVTLAVLFAMVWLIDYSSPRSAVQHNQQPLLLPERADETAVRKPGTLFETLLTKTKTKNADSDRRVGPSADPAAPAGSPQFAAPSGRSLQPAAVKGSAPARTEAPASGLLYSVPSGSDHMPVVTPAAPQAQASGEVFAVQFGSFLQEERARQLSEDLAARGYKPYMTTISMPDGTKAHRVRVGRFATREEAMKLAAAIESVEKISVFVTSK